MQIAPEFLEALMPKALFSIQNFGNFKFHQKMKIDEELTINQAFGFIKGIIDILINNGVEQPTKLQAQAIRFIMQTPYQNFGMIGPAGIGKTLVYIVTIMQRAHDNFHDQYLILEPTKILAEQVFKYVKLIGEALNLRIALYVKGIEIPAVGRLPQVIVSTPGMAMQMLKCHFISKNVGILVLDEIDVVLKSTTLVDQYLKIMSLIKPECQMLLFGRDLDKDERQRIDVAFEKPFIINGAKDFIERVAKNQYQHFIIYENDDEKILNLRKLVNALQADIKTIIFVRTNEKALWLYKQVKTQPKIALLTKDYQLDFESEKQDISLGDKMIGIIDRFRDSKTMIMITTDMMAVGININDLLLVVNYDLPYGEDKKFDNSVFNRRNGRIARFGKTGEIVSFIREDFFSRDIKLIQADHELINEMDVIENIGNYTDYLRGIYLEYNGVKLKPVYAYEYREN